MERLSNTRQPSGFSCRGLRTWGLLLALAGIYAWGFGDAAAALVGKQWGRHKIHLTHADHHKSVEGSAAMFLCAVISVTVVLVLRGGLSMGKILLTAVVTALVSTLAELYSKDGHDTVICPLSAMAVLLPVLHLLGGTS